MNPPLQNGQNNGHDLINEFQFDSEMGPVADMSTFPPTMATAEDNATGMLSMDSILSGNFWDSVLVPGKLCSLQLYQPIVLIFIRVFEHS